MSTPALAASNAESLSFSVRPWTLSWLIDSQSLKGLGELLVAAEIHLSKTLADSSPLDSGALLNHRSVEFGGGRVRPGLLL